MVFAEVWCLSRADLRRSSDGANINGIMGESCGEYVRAAARVYDPSRVERVLQVHFWTEEKAGRCATLQAAADQVFLARGQPLRSRIGIFLAGVRERRLPDRIGAVAPACAPAGARVCQARPTSLLPSARTHLVAT